jgi:DNA-binding protein Fis
MKEDMVTMSIREIERLRIVHKVMERRSTQVKAAEMMGVTDRQVRSRLPHIGRPQRSCFQMKSFCRRL